MEAAGEEDGGGDIETEEAGEDGGVAEEDGGDGGEDGGEAGDDGEEDGAEDGGDGTENGEEGEATVEASEDASDTGDLLLGGLIAAPVMAAGGTIFATSRRKGK